jgi:hypothetical protein
MLVFRALLTLLCRSVRIKQRIAVRHQLCASFDLHLYRLKQLLMPLRAILCLGHVFEHLVAETLLQIFQLLLLLNF